MGRYTLTVVTVLVCNVEGAVVVDPVNGAVKPTMVRRSGSPDRFFRSHRIAHLQDRPGTPYQVGQAYR